VLPMVIPHFLMGVALLIFFSFLQMPLSRVTVILGHVVFTMPFAIVVISTRLHGFDRTLELAAADLGANPQRTFRHVVLPIIMPGIVGAALLVFALSMDEFLITYFVSGQKGTMTMYIWSLLKDGIAPRVNALATVLILASFVLLLVGNWLTSKSSTGDRRR
jgi:spermidine/putrescine transport system permease protein